MPHLDRYCTVSGNFRIRQKLINSHVRQTSLHPMFHLNDTFRAHIDILVVGRCSPFWVRVSIASLEEGGDEPEAAEGCFGRLAQVWDFVIAGGLTTRGKIMSTRH